MSETPRTLADDPDEVILLLNDPDSVGRALPLCIATECIEKLQRELAQAQARCAELEKLLGDAKENLIWCGGSSDFGWGGKAQIGYDKGPRATIAAITALETPRRSRNQ